MLRPPLNWRLPSGSSAPTGWPCVRPVAVAGMFQRIQNVSSSAPFCGWLSRPLTMSSQPLIYVDGIRIYNEQTVAGPGARAATSPLQDIPAEDIDDPERNVPRATLWGTLIAVAEEGSFAFEPPGDIH